MLKNDCMGTKERREREKEQLKNDILDAANELFLQLGYEKTTMRKIADKIEYNPATIYSYFKNKEEIFYALQRKAFTAFYDAFSESLAEVTDPAEQLTKLGRTYISFGLKHPAYYDLMFIMRQPMQARQDDGWRIGERNFERLKGTVKACMRKGYLPREDSDAMALMIWASVHGLVSLRIRERLTKFDEHDLDFLIREAFTLFDKMLHQNFQFVKEP